MSLTTRRERKKILINTISTEEKKKTFFFLTDFNKDALPSNFPTAWNSLYCIVTVW